MKIAFLDEDGLFLKDSEDDMFDWVVMNTRETRHTQDFVFSLNPFILCRLFFLKIKELKELFSWYRVKFHWKTKMFLSVGCVFKTRDQYVCKRLRQGVVTFDEAMREHILCFINNQKTDFQIAFIFNTGWARCIEFRHAELYSSRLISLKGTPEFNADFIIADEEMLSHFEGSIPISEFGKKTGNEANSLKEFIFNMDFSQARKFFMPSPPSDFKFSCFSFYGKQQMLNQFLTLLVVGALCFSFEISRSHLIFQNNSFEKEIAALDANIKQDSDLKRRKEFSKIVAQKKLDITYSPLNHIQEFTLFQEQGFYAQTVNWAAQNSEEKMRFVLKPLKTRIPKEILNHFIILEKTLRQTLPNAEIIVHKPPFGIEKTKGEMRKTLKKKPSSKAKIEIIWNKKK